MPSASQQPSPKPASATQMDSWMSSTRLIELTALYANEHVDPQAVPDADFVRQIIGTFWGTNCWCFVEQSFAIIAPGCALRPHLARELIAHPIEAMIAGGLDDENAVIAQGVALAHKPDPYLDLTPAGRQWLTEQWPDMESVAIEVFREIRRRLGL